MTLFVYTYVRPGGHWLSPGITQTFCLCSKRPLLCEGPRAVRGDDRGVLPVFPEIDGGVRWELNHVRLNFGETPSNHLGCSDYSSPKFPARGGRIFHAGFDFGVPSFVPFFGRAKKGTTLFLALPERSVHSFAIYRAHATHGDPQ